MRLQSIEMEGFQSHQERERIDLDGLNLVAVIGPNGAGKTTMLNGIEFALFGKYRGDGINSVISRGAKQAEVTVEFKLNDSTYKVRRVKSGNRHEVYVNIADESAEDGWKILEEKNPKMADPFLRELIGMDYETARTTWLISQNDFGAFCELQPAQRRVVLTNAFGLNKFVELAERADQNVTRTGNKLATAEVKLEQLKARRQSLESDVSDPELNPLSDEDLEAEGNRIEEEDEKTSAALSADLGDVDTLQERVKVAQENLRSILGSHEKDVARHADDLRRAERAVQQAQEAAQQARTTHEAASTAAWDVEDAQEAHAAAQAKVEEIEASLPGLREQVMEQGGAISAQAAKVESTKAAAAEINERIATLNRTAHGHEGECFACGQALSEERAQKMLADLEAEKEALRAAHTEADQAGRAASVAKKEAQATVATKEQALRGAQGEARKAETEHRDLVKTVETLPQLEAALSKAEAMLEQATTEQATASKAEAPVLDEDRIVALRAEVDTASETLQGAKDSSENRQELRNTRDGLRSRQKRVWAEQSRRERVAKEISNLVKPTEDLQGEYDALARDVLTYRTLREAFRPSGIPAMILSGVVEELNDDANEVLMDLGGQFGVNVTTQKEKANGGTDEKVMVYVTTPEGEIDYTTLSGSERFRCALALRIALARCIARRTGTPIETIIMDEGWGSLDDEYRKAVQDVLLELSSDFAVYTVSHIDEIKASFPTVIEVNKDTGTSRAEVYSR